MAIPMGVPKPAPKSGTPKNLRIRQRLFPKADSLVFKNATGGFVSFPIVLRRLLRHLKPKQLEMLVYLWLRCDRYYLCYPTVDEIASELGLQNTSRVKRSIRELETAYLVQTRTSQGRMYFLVLDPRHAFKKLYDDGKIEKAELEEINELLEKLKHTLIVPAKKGSKAN